MQRDDFDLTYNPFDDEDNTTNELTNPGRQYYSSTFVPSASTPFLTRRKSSAGESLNSSGSTIRRRHKRSRSDLHLAFRDDAGESPSSGHPLKSGALKTGDFKDFGITRPHLSRVVQSSSVDSTLFSSGSSSADEGRPSMKELETEVLLHEVATSDSLAGVSLKYGIDLTELRRANQLWNNDSIHLREILLIPLHRASRAHEYTIRPPLNPTMAPPTSHGPSSRSSGSQISSESVSPTPTTETNVRRVPLSQLSYFPPASNSHKYSLTDGILTPPNARSPSYSTIHTKPLPPLVRSTPTSNHSLTSLLNILPITSSTRDEIASRLSLDSGSSSGYNDRARSSRNSSEEESGHEMNNVHMTPALSFQQNPQEPDHYPDSRHTPKVSQRLKDTTARYTGNGRSQSGFHFRKRLSTSPPASYLPQTQNPYVRTVQMEPSPGMKLPLARSNSDSGYTSSPNRFLDPKRPQHQAAGLQQAREW